jgi:1-aminocyclopropane-1-carboxylate deaminase/D-cysteine desulfhydrase-like pyridoxal-dependent ACC family enzyme
MKTAAFITYNQLGEGKISTGWHESDGRRALVLQNTKGEGSLKLGKPIGAEKRAEQISLLWAELRKELSSLDHVVVYVGTRGSEEAIKLAAELPEEKVTFVGCDCGLPIKELLIRAAGLPKAGRILCECGGHHTMLSLYERFMATGVLHPTVH